MIDPCPVYIAPWWKWYPPVGTFVAVLAVVGVYVPWQRAKASRPEIALWTTIMFLLMFLELRSLKLDRTHNDNDQEHSQCVLLQNFRDIGDKITTDMDNNRQNFIKTLGGIQSTLDTANSTLTAANKTLEQTRPIAIVKQDRIEFLTAPDQKMRPDVPQTFNDWFSNSGTADAIVRLRLVKLYVDTPDDKDKQTELVLQFEKAWSVARQNAPEPFVLAPFVQRFISTARPFSIEEMRNLAQGTKAIYLLERIEYSDNTGTWRSDHCSYFQSMTSINVQVPCKVFIDQRYPTTRASSKK